MTYIKLFGCAMTFLSVILILPQQDDGACCTIIDINKDSGMVLVREVRTGWIKAFKPDALDLAELNIGDSLDVSMHINQVSRLNGKPKDYPLLQPHFGAPCCEVLSILKDSSDYIIIAKAETDDSLKFHMPDTLASQLISGHKIFTSPSHGYAMVLAALEKDTLFFGFPLLDIEQ